MKRIGNLTVLALVATTHAISGAGIALLLSERIPVDRRRRLGRVLVSVGAALHVVTTAVVLRGRNHENLLGRGSVMPNRERV